MISRADPAKRASAALRALAAAVALLTTGLPAVSWAEQEGAPSDQMTRLAENQRIDEQLRAIDDPMIVRQRLVVPSLWPAPRMEPPFNQQPLNAQDDFCTQPPC